MAPAPRRFTLEDADAVYQLASQATPLGEVVKHAIGIIDQAVAEYGLDHLSLSFNGGKDCTVLVHLLAASIFRHHALSTPAAAPSIRCVYVRCSSPFPQVEAFVKLCTERYHLDLEAVEGGMRDALEVYLNRHASERDGGIKAVLVGTRRGDPHGAKLTPFTRTDAGWPDFMRVHPVLDWSYKQIWEFLCEPSLTLGGGPIEWCELYDYGYTSLGSTHNTFPNPLLKATDDPAVLGGWRPAWDLEDESQERAGREVPKKKTVVEEMFPAMETVQN